MAGHWDSLIDRLLQEARDSGKFDNLPGQGKPIHIEDDSHTPPDLRLAHKILKDNDLVPEWIMHGKDIDAMHKRLVDNMRKGMRAYRGALADAERSGDAARQQQAEATWQRACETFQRAADKINSEILSYNLKVPQGIPHKFRFNLEYELKRLGES